MNLRRLMVFTSGNDGLDRQGPDRRLCGSLRTKACAACCPASRRCGKIPRQ